LIPSKGTLGGRTLGSEMQKKHEKTQVQRCKSRKILYNAFAAELQVNELEEYSTARITASQE